MKPPLVLTLVILAAGIFWGVRENQQLTTLREQHRLITQQAADLGISVNPASSLVLTQSGKRQIGDASRKKRDLAELIVAYTKEQKDEQANGQRRDPAAQTRIIDLADGLLSLNGAEFKLLIDELRERRDMDDEMRQGTIYFTISMLAQQRPEAAVALVTGSPDLVGENPRIKDTLPIALSQWAKDQPLAALEWIKKNAARFPDLVTDDAKRAVIAGAALNDFGLAFQLIGEIKLSAGDGGAMAQIARAASTPERRMEFLAALRQQLENNPDQAEAGKLYARGFRQLLGQVAGSGYDQAMAWLATAKLAPSESAGLMENLNYYQTKADTGKWLDWIATQPVAGTQSESATRNLVRNWTEQDYRAAGEWLTHAPAGPLKETAVASYLETIAPYDPDVAAQWAATLPVARQKAALQTIYQKIGQQDKAAAAAFATRHGLDP
jgi:hypothetical protein